MAKKVKTKNGEKDAGTATTTASEPTTQTKWDEYVVHEFDALGGARKYDGKRGSDTLALSFTAAEWEELNEGRHALRDALHAFGETLVAAGTSSTHFLFGALDITARRFEKFEVLVDGTAVSLKDASVTAGNGAVDLAAGDVATLDLATLVNAPDGLRGLEIASTPTGDGTQAPPARVLDGTTVSFDAATDFAALGAGESAQFTYGYSARDLDGDVDAGELTLTVHGVNDAPQTEDIAVRVAENASNFAPLTQEDGARTIVNAGGFYVLDADAGTLTFVARGEAGLSPDDVAPENGAVVYINPNTSNWFIEAVAYADGAAAPVAASDFVVSGYAGRSLARGETLYFLEGGDGISISLDIPAVGSAAGSATASVTLEGLFYEPYAANVVTVDHVAVALEPEGTEPAVAIEPVVHDPDAGDTFTLALDTHETQGTVTVVDGTMLYDQGNGFGYLAAGESATDTFRYTATDEAGVGTTSTVTVTVEGTNDRPDATPLAAEVFAEGSLVEAFESGVDARTVPNAGMFYVLDQTTGELTVVSRTVAVNRIEDLGLADSVVIHVNPNTQSMFLEAARVEGGTVTAIDPMFLVPTGFAGETTVSGNWLIITEALDGAEVSLAVEGLATADGPADAALVLSGISYAGPGLTTSVDIAGAGGVVAPAGVETSVTVQAEVFDLDGDVFTFTLDTSATAGSVTHDGAGGFTYTAAGAFDWLEPGETAVDTFTYTATDEAGGFDTATVTITNIGLVAGNGTEDAMLA